MKLFDIRIYNGYKNKRKPFSALYRNHWYFNLAAFLKEEALDEYFYYHRRARPQKNSYYVKFLSKALDKGRQQKQSKLQSIIKTLF